MQNKKLLAEIERLKQQLEEKEEQVEELEEKIEKLEDAQLLKRNVREVSPPIAKFSRSFRAIFHVFGRF